VLVSRGIFVRVKRDGKKGKNYATKKQGSKKKKNNRQIFKTPSTTPAKKSKGGANEEGGRRLCNCQSMKTAKKRKSAVGKALWKRLRAEREENLVEQRSRGEALAKAGRKQ